MDFPRLRPGLALLSLLAFSGCGYVHLGPLPPAGTALGDPALAKENSDLRNEKGMLEQELALARQEGATLRAMLEKPAEGAGAPEDLAARLNDTVRQLAGLRVDYEKLQTERDRLQSTAETGGAGPAAQLAALKSKLGDTEDQLATALHTYTQLDEENARLRTEVDKTNAENSSLATQVKDLAAQDKEAQAALAQLNTELLSQKESRSRVEQEAETLRTQLTAANEKVATLAATRASAAGEASTLSAASLQVTADTSAREPMARLEANASRRRTAAAGNDDAAAPAGGTDSGADTAALMAQLNELRAKVASLEAERAALERQLAAGSPAGAAPPAEASAPGDTEAKLATALRSYTLLQNENDELKSASDKISAEKSAAEAQLAVTRSAVPLAAQARGLREQLRLTQAQAGALAEENERLKTRLALNAPAPAASRPAPTRPIATAPTSGPQMPAASSRLPAPSSAARTHTIAAGDTLAKISRQYYGTPDRWTDILTANRDILHDERSLVIGRVLRIP